MTRYSLPAFEQFLSEPAAKRTCLVTVRCGDDLPGGIGAYKLYVNGNIKPLEPSATQFPESSDRIVRLEPGNHRLVLREFDPHKVNRAESNALSLHMGDNTQALIYAGCKAGRLYLSSDPE